MSDNILPRFNHKASCKSEALEYYKNRAIQLSTVGWSWDGNFKDYGWGLSVKMCHSFDNKMFDSIFIFEKNKGHLSAWLKEGQRNMVVTPSCNDVKEYFKGHDVPYRIASPFNNYAYNAVVEFYGDKRAKRSNLPYMNHIDEGIFILDKIKASPQSIDAFCLHPIFQADIDFEKFKLGSGSNKFQQLLLSKVPSYQMMITMEYRSIANAYLSQREISSIEDIALSPNKDVNDMLIADKIQNYKDFILYHRSSHPRADKLEAYFNNWFKRLNITDDMYKDITLSLKNATGGNTI